MLAVIGVPPLSTVKLFALIPPPKPTAVAPSRLAPLMVTVRLRPWQPWLGLTEVKAGVVAAPGEDLHAAKAVAIVAAMGIERMILATFPISGVV